MHLPKRSSPKFPHPIFLPTRKLGPTISTPEEELTECRVEYILVVVPLVVAPPPVLTACDADVAGTALEDRGAKYYYLGILGKQTHAHIY